jgi:hypothetical protein
MADFSRQELIDYFNEHILYELLMLRFSRNTASRPGKRPAQKCGTKGTLGQRMVTDCGS